MKSVANILDDLFTSGSFLDVTLAVHGTELKSNRMLLACSSGYFHALFDFSPDNAQKSQFELHSDDFGPEGFEHVIKFINSLGQYCIPTDRELLGPIYAAASFLQVTHLQSLLSDLISHHLDSASVLCTLLSSVADHIVIGALRLAFLFDDQTLLDKSTCMLFNRFGRIDFTCDDFVQLTADQIKELFSSDHATVPSEAVMVRGMLHWLCHSVPERMSFFRNSYTQLLRLAFVSLIDHCVCVCVPD